MPNIPLDASKAVHSIPFDRVIYIDQSDFREVGGASIHGNNYSPEPFTRTSSSMISDSCRPHFSVPSCHTSVDARSTHAIPPPYYADAECACLMSLLCLCDCLLCLQDVPSGYRRLAPEQPVGLRHAGYTISVQKVTKVGREHSGVN